MKKPDAIEEILEGFYKKAYIAGATANKTITKAVQVDLDQATQAIKQAVSEEMLEMILNKAKEKYTHNGNSYLVISVDKIQKAIQQWAQDSEEGKE